MDQKENNKTWIDSASELVEDYRNLITVKVVEHTSLGLSVSIVGAMSLLIAMFVLLFAGLGAAWWLGEYLSNMKAGFFIIGGIFLVLFLLLLITSRKVWVPVIRDSIIKKIYEQD